MIRIGRVSHYREDLCKLVKELFPKANPVFSDEDVYFVAEGPELVGFAHLVVKEKKAVLQGIGVCSEWRGKGIGGRLLDKAVAYSEKKGLPIFLRVKPDNTAINLYASRGFIIKKIKGAYILERKLHT